MEQFFTTFENREPTTTSGIPFSFNEQNEIYCKTDKKSFIYIEYMYYNYVINQQIAEND
jgi:hypothetical protein